MLRVKVSLVCYLFLRFLSSIEMSELCIWVLFLTFCRVFIYGEMLEISVLRIDTVISSVELHKLLI